MTRKENEECWIIEMTESDWLGSVLRGSGLLGSGLKGRRDQGSGMKGSVSLGSGWKGSGWRGNGWQGSEMKEILTHQVLKFTKNVFGFLIFKYLKNYFMELFKGNRCNSLITQKVGYPLKKTV